MNELEQNVGLVLSRMSHDLKNPLAVILSNLRFLQMSITDVDDSEAIDESLISAMRLDRMLDDAVDINRIRRQSFKPSRRPCSVGELKSELTQKLELMAGRRTLDIDLPGAELITDREVLIRILINLLEHALRNTMAGGTVTLRGQVEDGLILEVLDQGAPFSPGPPSFILRDLDPKEESADKCRSDQGLGLHFAGVAARAMGADIDCYPRKDGESGVCFEISFPAELLP